MSNSLSQSAEHTIRPTKVRARVGSRMSGSSAKPTRSTCPCDDAAPNTSTKASGAPRPAPRPFASIGVISGRRSVEFQVLQPHQAVGDGAQTAELARIGPQPVAVIEVHDRPVFTLDRGMPLIRLQAFGRVERASGVV